MARVAPIIFALILNCSNIFIFRSFINVSPAPQMTMFARYLFTIGNYFLLVSLQIYPRSFRKIHWILRSFVEFIFGVYLFETFLCDFWFPLEYFAHFSFQKLIFFLRKNTPKTGPLCTVLCNIIAILSTNNAPKALSIALSSCISIILIHGTRTVDFGILRRCGMKDFVFHLKEQTVNGIKRFIFSLRGRTSSIRCRTHSSSRSR